MYFSIIIPVYNTEKYLSICVDSILTQNFSDFEVVLVDDGSKDGSPEICDCYAKQDNRIKVIHKSNGGQSTARNVGIREAVGKYLVFLDSDDFISDNCFLNTLYENINDEPDIVAFRYVKYYENRIDDCGISMAGIDTIDIEKVVCSLVAKDAFFCSCWSKIVKRQIVEENAIFFDENLSCEDMDWYYRVVLKSKTMRVIDKPFINYRQRPGSVTAVFKEKSIRDYIFTIGKWEKEFGEIRNEEYKTVLMSSLAKLYCNLLISYSRNRKQARLFKKDIFAFKKLLKFDSNPRTKKISLFSRCFGLNITCLMLSFLSKAR